MTQLTEFDKIDIEDAIRNLALTNKIALLGGKDFWSFEDVLQGKIKVPAVRTSDGPNGIRGRNFFNGVPASCFPCGTGLAASFDVNQMKRVGGALADEARAKSAHVVLGPTCNIQRSPLGGRGFESYSEDPLLSGLVASSYINGLQEKGVAACIKHFVCNDQEFERFSMDSVVGARALREIYLEPFRLAVKHSQPKSFMTGYNRMNGVHCSEDKELLEGIVRGEWKWDGLIMSDWTGVYSVDESIKAGLDVEMPGSPVMRSGPVVNRALAGEKLFVEDIDKCVRRVLELVNYAIDSKIPFYAGEDQNDSPELRALLREAASNAVVLLKNEASLLPLSSSVSSIAVIGSNAKVAFPSGGGSASLATTYTVTPLEAIQAQAKEIGASVDFAMGAAAFRFVPLLDPYLKSARVECFNGLPKEGWFTSSSFQPSKPDYTVETKTSLCFMIDGIPWDRLAKDVHCRYVAEFVPDISGSWDFGLGSIGQSSLFINDENVVENVESYKPGELFFNMGSEERRGAYKVEAGKTYRIEIRQFLDPATTGAAPFAFKASWRLGGFPSVDAAKARQEAADLAKRSEVAILVIGTNPDWESEGFDRKDMKLPGESDQLVKAVLAANPKTIVVNQSGTPVDMSAWCHDAQTVLQAFFGGNECGNGIADVIFGKKNPSGRLPLSFPVAIEDSPSYTSFGNTGETPGKIVYGEGIYVGYRHYDKLSKKPLFPFGCGLSYSTFSFSSLQTSSVSPDGKFSLSFSIKNTSSTDGSEVAQIYIAAPTENRIASPVKELKAFEKVSLKAGEEKRIEVKLEKEAFSYWNERYSSWICPSGAYRVLVATSSANDDVKLEGEIVLEKEFRWNGL
ncbi:beta-glucosidase [Sporobolomyces salmoneus]|uniref:beta-glucosidase n=1 Tax=Sporobolomyces salmoneus TaxID=183962 RepID=UPI00317AC5F9